VQIRANPWLAFVLIALACCTLPAFAAQGRVECDAVPSAILRHPVRYCVLLPPGYETQTTRRYPVLYFLHGLGDDEQALVTSGAWEIEEGLRQSGKIGDMLIAAPAGGRSFYINSQDGKVRYEDFFIREFIPAIEHRYRAAGTPAGRAITGVSMGGYGALRFAFKYPGMFTAAAAQMGALFDKLPPALTGASLPHGRHVDAVSAFGVIPDEAFWQQNSPLMLARNNGARLRHLHIYFDCGDQDDYGFDTGARSLHQILTKEGIPHEFHIYPGGHDWSYVAAHFAEVLEFEWSALAESNLSPQRALGAHRK
jgi:S-formylglutathione hydrolase FrmB